MKLINLLELGIREGKEFLYNSNFIENFSDFFNNNLIDGELLLVMDFW